MRYATTQVKNANLSLLLCTLAVLHNVINTLGCIHGSKTAPTPGAFNIEVFPLEQRPLNEKMLRFALDSSFPSYAKLTLVGLAYLADENGICDTSFEALGNWCVQRPLYIKRGIGLLLESGVIQAQGLGAGRGSVRYRIVAGK